MSLETLGAATATSLATAALAIRLGVTRPSPRHAAEDVPRARRWRPRPTRRSTETGLAEVADWCDLLARSLRSGCSLTAAVTAAAATESAMAGIISPVVRRVSRGDSLVVALDGVHVDPGQWRRAGVRRAALVRPLRRAGSRARSNGQQPRCAPVMPLPPNNWRRAPKRGCPPACSPSYRSPCSYFSG